MRGLSCGKRILPTLVVGLVWTVGLFFFYSNRPVALVAPFPNKVVHFSFDDVFDVFKDLHKNVDQYESVFDNEFLNDLKVLHKEYGAKFSLYIYEKDDSFNLADMPVRYKEELRKNSDWLKFGFHYPEPIFNPTMLSDSLAFRMSGKLSVVLPIPQVFVMFFGYITFKQIVRWFDLWYRTEISAGY